MRMRVALATCLSSWAAACSSTSSDLGSTGPSGPEDDASAEVAEDAPVDQTGSEPLSFQDAPPEAAPVVVADAGPFDCMGCACDGTTHYCYMGGGGAYPPAPDASPCPDVDAAAVFGCVPLPSSCVASPACDCVGVPFPGACQCNDVGGGLLVNCNFP